MERYYITIIIPTVSKLCELGRTPIVDTAPWDGRYPSIPQNDAGILTPPIVSIPTNLWDPRLIKGKNKIVYFL